MRENRGFWLFIQATNSNKVSTTCQIENNHVILRVFFSFFFFKSLLRFNTLQRIFAQEDIIQQGRKDAIDLEFIWLVWLSCILTPTNVTTSICIRERSLTIFVSDLNLFQWGYFIVVHNSLLWILTHWKQRIRSSNYRFITWQRHGSQTFTRLISCWIQRTCIDVTKLCNTRLWRPRRWIFLIVSLTYRGRILITWRISAAGLLWKGSYLNILIIKAPWKTCFRWGNARFWTATTVDTVWWRYPSIIFKRKSSNGKKIIGIPSIWFGAVLSLLVIKFSSINSKIWPWQIYSLWFYFLAFSQSFKSLSNNSTGKGRLVQVMSQCQSIVLRSYSSIW